MGVVSLAEKRYSLIWSRSEVVVAWDAQLPTIIVFIDHAGLVIWGYRRQTNHAVLNAERPNLAWILCSEATSTMKAFLSTEGQSRASLPAFPPDVTCHELR